MPANGGGDLTWLFKGLNALTGLVITHTKKEAVYRNEGVFFMYTGALFATCFGPK